MVESILNSIKKMLGIPESDTAFDEDILVQINSAFMSLNQLGVGPDDVYSIEDSTPTWSDFLSTNVSMYSAIKSYIYLKTKIAFDPPGTSFLLDAFQKQIQEIEWRLNVQVPIPPDPIV